MAKRTHVMTPARKAALRKAQLASARSRKHVTVYHYTSKRKANKIVKQQRFKSARIGPGNQKDHIYFTRRRSRFYQNEFLSFGRKSSVVSVRVPRSAVKRDPNDAWFQKNPYVAAARHKPANAYMVHKRHLVGRRIRYI